ncbi:MAG: hypothetical protein ACYTG7_15005 [Planctomycetota bacterium]|jgi:hypothetical protein
MMNIDSNPFLREEIHTHTEMNPKDYFDQWLPLLPRDENIEATRPGPADDEGQLEELLEYFEALY